MRSLLVKVIRVFRITLHCTYSLVKMEGTEGTMWVWVHYDTVVRSTLCYHSLNPNSKNGKLQREMYSYGCLCVNIHKLCEPILRIVWYTVRHNYISGFISVKLSGMVLIFGVFAITIRCTCYNASICGIARMPTSVQRLKNRTHKKFEKNCRFMLLKWSFSFHAFWQDLF